MPPAWLGPRQSHDARSKRSRNGIKQPSQLPVRKVPFPSSEPSVQDVVSGDGAAEMSLKASDLLRLLAIFEQNLEKQQRIQEQQYQSQAELLKVLKDIAQNTTEDEGENDELEGRFQGKAVLIQWRRHR